MRFENGKTHKGGPESRVVLITGGSRGLGLELARAFASKQFRVAICARTESDIQRAVAELQHIGPDVMGGVADVTSKDSVARFVHKVVDRWGSVDVLVNNAGVISAGPAEQASRADFERAMNTHFWGPMNMIDAVLPEMKTSKRGGRIVNISSVGGKIAVPHLLPYCASKFALAGFSAGLNAELAQFGISVTTVYPGLMRTGSPINASFKGNHRAEYGWFSISDSLPLLSMNAQRAANQIVRATLAGQSEVVLSMPAKLGALARSLAPNLLARVLRGVNRLLPGPIEGGKIEKSGRESESFAVPSILTSLTQKAEERNNEKAHTPSADVS